MTQWLTLFYLFFSAYNVLAKNNNADTQQNQWLLNTLKDTQIVGQGDVLNFKHYFGDVRVKAEDTDRIQITAIAQYHKDDPRVPKIRIDTSSQKKSTKQHKLSIEFPYYELVEKAGWENRRIDVGIVVPQGMLVNVETKKGLIEVKQAEAAYELTSISGEIIYEGTGDVTAHSERGNIFFKSVKTAKNHQISLSTLTGDIRLVLREGANAAIDLITRGPMTSDYSTKIVRKTGSPLKHGSIQVGGSGSDIELKSHSGGIRVQVINTEEK